ncbi:MAG TPA: MerR family transcriptional regulator [Pyrinomonadaceae bacterium]|nr:MerR family transcriptional regulator [Pyrinomonadaceae bacterium]
MAREPVVIPEKIYFKIGEVCELLDVQAHVLRYWESEFPQLAPQKNRSGQRSYRRRDVEISVRIKELLYDELYTIAGARKKLQAELRENGKAKNGEKIEHDGPGLFDPELELDEPADPQRQSMSASMTPEGRDALRSLGAQLLELREMLKTNQTEEASQRLRDR